MTDLLLSGIIFVLASPIFVGLTIVLYFANRGKPFFFQDRPGKDGKIFRLVKFRSMNDRRDSTGKLLPDKDRLTRMGKFVRHSSLDELPQLLNVLLGQMSLVGPRPLLVRYLERYNREQARRHEVRPGITGWAQVNGRNTVSWEKRFEYDVYYVDHLTWGLDARILWLTVRKVLRREGINSAEAATMPEFMGNNAQTTDR